MAKCERLRLAEKGGGWGSTSTPPDFNVLLDGQKVGECYFNMRGYTCFGLRIASGGELNLPEWPLGKVKREVAKLNREWCALAG